MELSVSRSREAYLENLGLLSTVQQDMRFILFLVTLEQQLTQVKADYKVDKEVVLCMFMLCFSKYHFNHSNFESYTGNEIHALVWRAINSSLNSHTILRKPIPEGLCSLIARRNAGEFKLWFLKNRGMRILSLLIGIIPSCPREMNSCGLQKQQRM
jgi:hypothetical protein